MVVGLPEGEECQAQLLDGVEAADPQQVLLQDPDEALGAAVPFRLADEGRRAFDAEEADLGLEVVAEVLTTVVVAEPKAGSDALGEAAMALADGLLDRLEGLEAIGAAAGMKADALGRAVIDGDEHCSLALAGHDRGQIGAPHDIHPLGDDRAVVGARAPRPAGTLVRQQAILAHQPQNAAPAGADAGKAQPGPQLAVALAMKGRGRHELPDRPHQRLVRHRTVRPRPSARDRLRLLAMAVDGRSRHAPDPRHPLQAIDLADGGRDLAAHRLDLRRGKGRSTSRRSIFASSSSAVIVSSPTLACSRPISASRASAGRLFSDASPPARNWSRQPLSSAAVTASSRETSSRSSPRRSRSTASCLRRTDIRRRGSGVGPSPPAWWARSAGPTPTPIVSSILTSLQLPTCKAVSQRTVDRGTFGHSTVAPRRDGGSFPWHAARHPALADPRLALRLVDGLGHRRRKAHPRLSSRRSYGLRQPRLSHSQVIMGMLLCPRCCDLGLKQNAIGLADVDQPAEPGSA